MSMMHELILLVKIGGWFLRSEENKLCMVEKRSPDFFFRDVCKTRTFDQTNASTAIDKIADKNF